MKVVWTQVAKRQLRAIHDYIAADSARYADRVVDRITRRTEELSDLPLSGAEVSEYGDPSIREILDYPYRVIYRVRAERLDIIAVIHGARLLPESPPNN
jgi:toxin ParE1/3/4